MLKGNTMNPEQDANYKVLHGSRLYGLSTTESDIDYRGFMIQPFRSWIGLLKTSKFSKYTRMENNEDVIIWSFKKFAYLAAKGNPQCIEMLYVPKDKIRCCDDFGQRVISVRDCFLSKNIYKPFRGYAESQKGNKKWYTAARLLYEGKRLLDGKPLVFPIPDPEHSLLKSIREGRYQDVERLVSIREAALETAYKRSMLPDEPNYVMINQLLKEAFFRSLMEQQC